MVFNLVWIITLVWWIFWVNIESLNRPWPHYNSEIVIFPDSRIWSALLAACRVQEDIRPEEYTAHRLLKLEPDEYQTLLSNVKASVGQWGKVEEVRRVIFFF